MAKTFPAAQEPNSLPNPELLKGKADFLAEYVGLPFNVYPPSWMYTDRLLEYTLRRVTDKVDLIALGPLTNLAHFLQESPLLFERKVKRIYFSGGEAWDSCGLRCFWPGGFEIQHTNRPGLALHGHGYLLHGRTRWGRVEHLQ